MQTFAIIASSRDPAGINIRNNLIELFEFAKTNEKFEDNDVYGFNIGNKQIKLYLTNDELIHSENIDRKIDADVFIFASKHQSKESTPSFAVHAIGNWGKADYGGRDGTVCQTSPLLLKLFIQNLAAVAKSEGYTGEVVQELTHHGPYIEKPAVFIELGSGEQQWKDAKLASMVADSLIGGLGDYVLLDEIKEHVPVVGLGGSHYARDFTKLMLDSNYAIGHICPKHHLASLTPELLQQALGACFPTATAAALDWKGLGPEKQRIKQMLDDAKIKYFKA